MRISVIAAVCLLLVLTFLGNAQQTSKFETRCGWFTNPTPANVWLQDGEAQWIIATQGGYQLDQDYPWPKFKKGQWVVTNVADYGHGCACFSMRVDKETHHVLEIKSARARPLSACRRDRALKKWNY